MPLVPRRPARSDTTSCQLQVLNRQSPSQTSLCHLPQPPVSGLTSTPPAPASIWQTPVSGPETRTRFRIITPPRELRLRHSSTATPATLIILRVLRACTPALAPANTWFRFIIRIEQLSDGCTSPT